MQFYNSFSAAISHGSLRTLKFGNLLMKRNHLQRFARFGRFAHLDGGGTDCGSKWPDLGITLVQKPHSLVRPSTYSLTQLSNL